MATFVSRSRNLSNILKNYSVTRSLFVPDCKYCKNIQISENIDVTYPPVKPMHPPGTWGERPPKQTWKMHEDAVELNKIPCVKERLESMAGELPGKHLWQVSPLDKMPGTLPYKQHITKTHVINDLPDAYSGLQNEAENVCEKLRPLFNDLIIQENERVVFNQHTSPSSSQAHTLLGQFINSIYAYLASQKEYILRSQLDENVRIESFWRKGGYIYDDDVKQRHKPRGVILDDVLEFQTKSMASYQIRMEKPLPEFCSLDDALSSGNVPDWGYSPSNLFQSYMEERPISVSGHWIGDPCEFNLLSVFVLGEEYQQFAAEHGDRLAEEEMKTYALVAGFGTSAAQAHNQGFNQHWDLTYPISSQIIVTDGTTFRFATYQLNTLHMWNSANPRRNLMWVSEPMRLYDAIQDGEVQGLNEQVLKNLLQFALVGPGEASHDLRPYLPEQPAPGLGRGFINLKGQPPLDIPVIGRWQYPRNSVYFT